MLQGSTLRHKGHALGLPGGQQTMATAEEPPGAGSLLFSIVWTSLDWFVPPEKKEKKQTYGRSCSSWYDEGRGTQHVGESEWQNSAHNRFCSHPQVSVHSRCYSFWGGSCTCQRVVYKVIGFHCKLQCLFCWWNECWPRKSELTPWLPYFPWQY